MQFLFIISHDDRFRPTPRLVRDIGTWIGKMAGLGVRVDGNPLQPPGTATTVRVRGGKVVRKAGPFSRSKEQICAYELVDCSSAEEAIEAAATHPMAKAATIEVRPIWTELVR